MGAASITKADIWLLAGGSYSSCVRARGSRLPASNDGCCAVAYSSGQELLYEFFQLLEISEHSSESELLGSGNSQRQQNKHERSETQMRPQIILQYPKDFEGS